ncbi:hypothetical protein [Streptomyces anulatus]|uniref:hypothetical protein n=1 Tax=Streptomyces anulatus TaxID=1892 RepID=UPI0036BDDF8C
MQISARQASERAESVGGRLRDLTLREPRGRGQVCTWDLVVTVGQEAEDRAAAAWVVADEIMLSRTDSETEAYDLWREAALSGEKLVDVDREYVLSFAAPVFEANDATGVTGYVGEWLWYLSTRDLDPEPGRSVEFLDPPSSTVSDSGPDGFIIHRVEGGAPGFVYRLWEMKKFTGTASQPSDIIRGAWQQLNSNGAKYLSQMSFGGRLLAADTRVFVKTLTKQWVRSMGTANAGVSLALNAADTPETAFERSHHHFTTHKHAGALQGLMVAVDDLEGFAKNVREYVWSGL